jgi:hypothetical protein
MVEISFIILAPDLINTQHKAKYSILYTKYKDKNSLNPYIFALSWLFKFFLGMAIW